MIFFSWILPIRENFCQIYFVKFFFDTQNLMLSKVSALKSFYRVILTFFYHELGFRRKCCLFVGRESLVSSSSSGKSHMIFMTTNFRDMLFVIALCYAHVIIIFTCISTSFSPKILFVSIVNP